MVVQLLPPEMMSAGAAWRVGREFLSPPLHELHPSLSVSNDLRSQNRRLCRALLRLNWRNRGLRRDRDRNDRGGMRACGRFLVPNRQDEGPTKDLHRSRRMPLGLSTPRFARSQRKEIFRLRHSF